MRSIAFIAVVAAAALACPGQSKSNDRIASQIRSLDLGRNVTVNYDRNGDTSKLMAVADNFAEKETDHAGILAMNFAMGYFYPGNELKASSDPILFSFWVKTKRPRFAESHSLTVKFGNEEIDLGEARYAAKAREEMEYLNFSISRSDLEKIAHSSGATLFLGTYQFHLTHDQTVTIAGFVNISEL